MANRTFLRLIFVLIVSELSFATAAQSQENPPDDRIVTLEMSEQQYSTFKRKRDNLTSTLFNTRLIRFQRLSDNPRIRIRVPNEEDILIPPVEFWVTTDSPEKATQVCDALQHFPETRRFAIELKTIEKIPDELTASLKKIPTLEGLTIRCVGSTKWPEGLIEAIATKGELRQLHVSGKLHKADDLMMLKDLAKLNSIGFGYGMNYECFRLVAKLPQANRILIRNGAGFPDPILPEIQTAIEALDGRPIVLNVQKGKFHPSFFRAAANVSTLKMFLFIGHMPQAKLDDFAGLEALEYLESFDMNVMGVDRQLHEQLKTLKQQISRRAMARASRARRFAELEKRLSDLPELPGFDPKQPLYNGAVDAWIKQMAENGSGFDPRPVLAAGDDGLSALLQRVFPEAFQVEEKLTADEVNKYIEQLSDDSFRIRQDAYVELIENGRSHRDLLQKATKHEVAEVRSRAREILARWSPPNDLLTRDKRFGEAFSLYLSCLTEFSSDEIVAEVLVKSLENRVDQTDRKYILRSLCECLISCHDDRIHNKLARLCKLDDPDAAIFTIKTIAGRTGNSYVSPIHIAAIQSGRDELQKAGFSNMPGPVWDRQAKPIILGFLKSIFTDSGVQRFKDDPQFLQLAAFSASRSYDLQAARKYLLELTESDDSNDAMKALELLADLEYSRHSVTDDLFKRCRAILQSDNDDFKVVALRVLGIRICKQREIDLIVDAVKDNNDAIWQAAVAGMFLQKQMGRGAEFEKGLEQLDTKNNDNLRKRVAVVKRILNGKERPEWLDEY